MDEIVTRHSAIMDRYDPEQQGRPCSSTNGAPGTMPRPGTNPGFLFQQNTLRDAVVAALDAQHLPPPCRPREDGQHRPDGERAAGDDPDRRAADADDADLSCLRHVPGRSRARRPYPATVTGPRYRKGGNDLPMVDVSAARGADGRLYLALVNLDPHRAAHVDHRSDRPGDGADTDRRRRWTRTTRSMRPKRSIQCLMPGRTPAAG